MNPDLHNFIRRPEGQKDVHVLKTYLTEITGGSG
jgi:hypothetical protein